MVRSHFFLELFQTKVILLYAKRQFPRDGVRRVDKIPTSSGNHEKSGRFKNFHAWKSHGN